MESTAANETAKAELSFQRAEFLAEDELIDINPMVKSGVIRLIRGEFGPFEPSITSTVCSSKPSFFSSSHSFKPF